MSFWISGVVTVIVSCVGIVGNVLSLVVLCKKVRIKNNKNNNDVLFFSKTIVLLKTFYCFPRSCFLCSTNSWSASAWRISCSSCPTLPWAPCPSRFVRLTARQYNDHHPCTDPVALQHPDVSQLGVRQSLQSLHLCVPHRQLHSREAPGQAIKGFLFVRCLKRNDRQSLRQSSCRISKFWQALHSINFTKWFYFSPKSWRLAIV